MSALQRLQRVGQVRVPGRLGGAALQCGGLQLQSMSPLAPLLVMLVTRQLLHHRIFTLLDCLLWTKKLLDKTFDERQFTWL